MRDKTTRLIQLVASALTGAESSSAGVVIVAGISETDLTSCAGRAIVRPVCGPLYHHWTDRDCVTSLCGGSGSGGGGPAGLRESPLRAA